MSTPRFLKLPVGVRQRSLPTARGDFAILEAGEDGPLIVLVPGWTGSKEDFIAVLAPIAAAGFHVVSLDQRGQYQTAGNGNELDYALDALASDLLAVLAAARSTGNGSASPAAHVVGHSFGGLVARAAAVADPSAFATLTLLCSGPSALPTEVHPLLNAMIAAIDGVGLAAAWQAKRAYENSIGAIKVSAEIEQFLQERFLANDPVSLQAITRHLITAPDAVEALATTGIPVQVAFGEDDDGWPRDAQRDMAAQLDAPVRVIPGAGHSPAVDQPTATVAALVPFWQAISVKSQL